MRRVVVLGRGGAGKSVLARRLSELTGLPVVELDALFWQPGLVAEDPERWAARQRELVQRDTWIIDGDLGPYDSALEDRLRAADTVIVLDFAFVRCAWRTVRRGRERGDYWRWVWAYRRRSLPALMGAVTSAAPGAEVHVLRGPRGVRRFVERLRRSAG
jgi:adenylate kinase family enzyme